jgi:superfamily I DNA/RNA helicase
MVARVACLVAGGTPDGPPAAPVPAKNIAVLSYTRAASGEFRERLAQSLGKAGAKEVACATFHSFCLEACRAHAPALGRTPAFILYGEAQSRKVAAACAAASRAAGGSERAPDEREAKAEARRAAARLARHKAAGATPAALAAAGDAEDAALLRVS